MQHQNRPVPDYTTPALVMGFVNLLWIFAVIWAQFGLVAVMATAWVLYLGIERLRPQA